MRFFVSESSYPRLQPACVTLGLGMRPLETRALHQIVRSDERNRAVRVHVSLLGGRFPPRRPLFSFRNLSTYLSPNLTRCQQGASSES